MQYGRLPMLSVQAMTLSSTSSSASGISCNVSLFIPSFRPPPRWQISSSKSWPSYCLSSPLQRSKLRKGGSVSSSFNAYLPKAQSVVEKFTKKLLGEKDVESVLQKLDRLTQDEARMTIAQTLDIVYGLVGNMRVVMDGARWAA